MSSEQQIKTAEKHFFHQKDLTFSKAQNVLESLMMQSIDYADIYFQQSYSESWMLEESTVKSGTYAIDQGAGIRAISGDKTGFAFTNDLSAFALNKAAGAVKEIATRGKCHKVAALVSKPHAHLYADKNPLKSLSDSDKVAVLQKIDKMARKVDPRISQVITNLVGSYEIILIMASDGTLAADIRPLVRLNVSVIAEAKNRREQGFSGCGGRFEYEFIVGEKSIQNCIEEATRTALINLEAVDAPAGTMPVVLGAGWPGVILHEAVGHGLESDFNRKGTSVFAGKIGQKVASELCTIVDDGTLKYRRGSLSIDDEGTPTKCTTLIENGILKNYMQDKLNARLMGMQSTGNARRESFAHLPIPRMTNTYMQSGKYSPEEIIKTVNKGLYAVNLSGGQVDITSGKFVFSTSEAYLIENGKVTKPVKGATLIGDGVDVLQKISMVGNDLKLDGGVGICGKDGQSVPVGVGQPTVKVDELTVGGVV